MLSTDLVAKLVCVKSKRPLIYFPRGEEDRDETTAFLFCPASRLRYRIEKGVPVMLEDEAISVPEAAANQLIARAKTLGLAVPA